MVLLKQRYSIHVKATNDFSIQTKRLQLCIAHTKLAQLLLDYNIKNSAHLKEWISRSAKDYLTLEKQHSILASKRKAFFADSEYRFYMFHAGDVGRIIGNFAFSHVIRGAFHSCYLGYQMDQDFINRGLITEAIAAGIDFVFNEKNLHRIEANIMPRNRASVRVVEKLSFLHEGSSKNYLRLNGRWEDHDRYVLFNKNWKAPD